MNTLPGFDLGVDSEELRRERGAPRPGGGDRSRRSRLRFNSEVNNSPAAKTDADIMPDYRGGKLDPVGGAKYRLADLERFEFLSSKMRMPVFLTLTLNREKLKTPEIGYGKAMGKICDLLTERLGVRLWGRVIEAQADSGDGWIHWHIVADMAATRFDLSRIKRRPWIDLGSLQEEVKDWWCGRWKLGGVGGQDIQRVKKRGAVAGYLCKYVAKPWPAIPEWVLAKKMIRLVGFSKAANVLFREAGMVKPRGKKKADAGGMNQENGGKMPENPRKPKEVNTNPDSDPNKTIRRREVSPLIVRLPWSGLMCKVISCGEFIGTIKCKEGYFISHLEDIPREFGLYYASRYWCKEYKNGCRSECTQVVIRMKDATREKVNRLNRWLEQQGICEQHAQEAEKRTSDYLMGWEIMQAWRYDC